jgi:hypothetical protein
MGVVVGLLVAVSVAASATSATPAMSGAWAAPGTSAAPASPAAPMADHGADAFPDTSMGIHVFDDQLPGTLPPALIDFVAGHVEGSQKLPRSLADALHARNAGFVVLQYRLGIGLGYRTADGDCRPTGADILILDGDDWVREWPDEADATWFAGASTTDDTNAPVQNP